MTETKMFDPSCLESARALFPHVAQGKIYMNHAATAPLSTRVLAALESYLRDRSEGKIDNYSADMQIVGRCREQVARMINAPTAERIAFAANTSDALNVIASGLSWATGDRILLNDLEFPANVYPFLNLKRHGVELDVIPCPDGKVTPEMIESHLTPRTRMVALSAVQFLSGYRADLVAIGEICRNRGIIFVVDGIQAVGAVAIDVQKMHIDALAAGGQKWQMAPHGTGFLFLTKELQDRITQQSLGWLSVHDPWDFRNYEQPLALSARRYEGGSLNMPGLYGMEAALATLLSFGTTAIEQHILALTGRLIAALGAFEGISLVTSFGPAERAGIVTVRLPQRVDGVQIFKKMIARNVHIAVREGKLRFAPHFYNTAEEIDTAVDVTRECLRP